MKPYQRRNERDDMNEESGFNRRRFMRWAGGAAAAAAVALLGSLPRRAWSAALPHLTQSNNATAKALQYVEDNTQAAGPHKAGQECSNCSFYHGGAGEEYGPCDLYQGFSVHSKGWCAGYALKP